MNQSKKILAALVAIPASVVVADGAMAAEETETKVQTLEFSNDFTGKSSYSTQTSTKDMSANTVDDLTNRILFEMSQYTKGFTITYTGNEVDNYNEAVEDALKGLKDSLNGPKTVTITSNDTATFDTTELYGTYKNMRVKATETWKEGKITAVKLEFSVNYFGTITNSESKELKDAKAHYEKNLKTKVDAATSDVAKVKIIHDYVVQSTRYVETQHSLSPTRGLSSHGYALWMYMLLKQVEWTIPLPNPEVRYVYGVVDGEYRSWNVIELDGQWYHLDAASDDTAKSGDTLIKYHHFLTNKPNEKRIDVGIESTAKFGEKYNHFLTADNQAQSSKHIYYADAETSGELFRIDLSTLEPQSLGITKDNATSGKGRILYYEHTSKDTAGVTVVAKKLYFINDSQGKYLYSYDVDTKKLDLVLKKQLASISLSRATLLYETLNDETGNIPLAYLNTFDQERADVVIKAIEKLEDIDKTTPAYKKAVTDARKLYMGLTKTQKSLVNNIDVLKRLEQEIEKGSSIINVINLINGLDEMLLDYVDKVEEAAKAYQTLGEADKSKVYNNDILKEAEAKINEAKALNKALQDKISGLGEDESPFEKFPDFIVFMEDFFEKYDIYLPSIRTVFTNNPEFNNIISTYRSEVEQYRTETQNFINRVKIIDENAESFLIDMEPIEKQYEQLLPSQKYLISDADADGDKVLKKLEKAKEMQQQVNRFNELMSAVASVTSDDVATIELTDKLVSDMREAQKLYDEMKLSQKNALSQTDIDKLTPLINRINGYANNEALKTLIRNISALDISKMTSLDELIAAVTSADTARIVMEDMGIQKESELFALLSPEVAKELWTYRKLKDEAVNDAKPLQKKMDKLTDESTKDDVKVIRDSYEKLEPKLKVFLKEELKKLEKHELRWKNADLAEKAKGVIDKINALSDKSTFEEVKAVFDAYKALDPEVQALVTNSQKLLDLWGKVSADAEAYQKAIDAVNQAIKDLSDKSTREDIQKVMDAYELLSADQKAKVINYEKIEELLSKLGEKEQGELDQIAANKVKELISALSNESTAVEIAEARAAYETLSAGAKALITDKVLEVLKFYESRLTELSEQAKKEAAVVQDRIDRITSSYTEAQIKNIRIAYNALSQLAKEYVTNLQKLIDAENKIIYENTVVKQAKLDANAFDVYMNDITRNSSQAEIAKARAYYNNLSTEAKKHVTTYEKLVRLETMWKDPKYIELVYTYYPDYIHDIKPGGIVIEKPKYDSIYIPDDSETDSPSSSYTPSTDWTTYDTMKYQNGRYTASITTTQAQSIKDRSKILKADDIEIVLPTADLDAATATVGVTVNITNNQLNIQFKQGKQAKTFSEYVEIHVPFNVLNGNASQIIERVAESNSSASFKIEGSSFIIRTKTSGTFKATAAPAYSDLPNNAQGTAMRELAKRGILFEAKPRLSQSYKQVTKFEAASMMATALGLSSASQSSYQDVKNERDLQHVQGLLEAGIMSGFTSSYFNGEGAVTKQEAAIMIANMYRYLNRDVSRAYSGFSSSFKDITYLSLEARQSIAILELFGVVNAADSFGPTKELTRGEFAELFYNALKAIDYL